ncbi:hypothetical protein QBC40DRAFT_180195 [Triangularia verruculosa]|uniref:Uncharacterized protein n=1 Tax=Triangularia verruculosa TaxID=2587418 RepID=A0AAN6XE69_9PEZI|nr:hypothetical protein QBC40DRAFT_180195 [Triangularia verruculosa]
MQSPKLYPNKATSQTEQIPAPRLVRTRARSSYNCKLMEGAHIQLDRGDNMHRDRSSLSRASPTPSPYAVEDDLLGMGAWASTIPYPEVPTSSVRVDTAQRGIPDSARARLLLCGQYIHDIRMLSSSSQPNTVGMPYDARNRISLEQHVRVERRRVEYGMLERYLEEPCGLLISIDSKRTEGHDG